MNMRVGIIIISDKGAKGERIDQSGPAIRKILDNQSLLVAGYQIIPDEKETIKKALIDFSENLACDLILTSGGTGLGPRDVTPEATLSIVDKVVPGLAEAMRAETFSVTPFAILSRAVAGIRGKCLIINLPGSPKAVRECLQVLLPVIPHAVEIIKGEVTEHVAQDTEKD